MFFYLICKCSKIILNRFLQMFYFVPLCKHYLYYMFKRFFIGLLLITAFSVKAQNHKQDFKLGKSMEILLNLFRETNLYYVDSTNPEKMLKDAATAMLKNLDPYTVFIPGDEMEDFQTMLTGKYAGVGALIRQKNGWVEISEPYKNTPSDKAGLRAGDRLVAIDNISLKGATSERVSSLLRGEPGTSFKLQYTPLIDTTIIKEVVVKREVISQPSVPYFGFIKEGIGYIRFDSFTNESSNDVRSAIESLKKQGKLNSLILDLRQNGGGDVGEAVKIASFFVPRSTEIVSMKGKIKSSDMSYKTKATPIEPDLPLAILMSSVSASSSEILAGALQDLDRAVIIGQRSYGKGLVQSPRPIGYDAYLKVTTAKYYTPSGRCIQALDYSNQKEDGSVGHIPDSLCKEFATVTGRKVYGGGGIQPDIKMDDEHYSKFTAILLGYGFIDDFTNIYAATNSAIDIDKFVVTDSLYNCFVEFMRDKEIKYESVTAYKLKELKDWAEREKYADRLTEEFAAIERKIAEDKIVELKTFRGEIEAVLAESIMTRWHYGEGGIIYSLKSDEEVEKACQLLGNNVEYKRILTEQDTTKN